MACSVIFIVDLFCYGRCYDIIEENTTELFVAYISLSPGNHLTRSLNKPANDTNEIRCDFFKFRVFFGFDVYFFKAVYIYIRK